MVLYAGVLAVSVAIAAFELILRYRDAPTLGLYTGAGLAYIAVNGAAGAGAVAIADLANWAPDLAPVLRGALACIAAVALMRSAVLIIRVGENNASIGPRMILEILLMEADRQVDRRRAAYRAEFISRLMRDVPFDVASDRLPALSLALMQHGDADESDALRQEVARIKEDDMSPESKSLLLGLSIVNHAGPDTLRWAVEALEQDNREARG
jgi:hypothetical protein